MENGKQPVAGRAPIQASEQFLRGILSLDRLTKVLVEMEEVPVTAGAGSAEELLANLEYVEGLLDDIVESGATVPVAFRLPVELMERLDGYVKRLNGADPSRRVTHSAVVCQLLAQALAPPRESE